MAKVLVSDQYLGDIADAIRTKKSVNTTYTLSEMADAILSIPTGGGAVSLQSKTATPTESQQVIKPDSNYDGLSQVTINAISTTYVGSEIARNNSNNLSISGAIVTVPAGYYATAASKTFPSGSAEIPATTITATPNISMNSSGLITASVSSSKSITPIISAGYITSGIAGTITASGNDTLQLTTKAAETFTPGTTNQTIAAQQYLTGIQTISGDADLIASNIKHEVDIFGVIGTFQTRIDSVTVTPSSRNLTITFNGLKAQPLAFACTQEGQTTFSKSYRWIISVTYDGTTTRNETHGVSGSSMIGYTFTNCTWTYSNGSLTITSPSSGANGYFKDGIVHRLIYIYEE